MLSQGVIDRIRQLLAEDTLSQRRIAALLKVSRGTVAAVSNGRRRDPKPNLPDEDDALVPRGPIGRCPQCGGWVRMPCQLCRARRRIARRRLHQRLHLAPCLAEPIRLELRGEHLRRYQAIHARRVRDGEWHATGGQPPGDASTNQNDETRMTKKARMSRHE
ncbi:MAG: helix-turn-helix transcriptional regulator [Pirellulales bacterium]|nr:helix-turn-helix transcriptional regulator [Pirellulales bacterium]